ncbi:hypothetical protein CYLTODRAFT_470119 [Cylindrobasidium torrendii FP15055 ss-10]|uniref:Chitin-binding type-4 domain-containing protein n=1 Tax=Cylindrobasidium torrendii FP15055 ss-10 TaxID=1314674 RepID=A0A0D7AZU0_9AGAR|nr:hypothetical protein CYLTODRAFT_470119 [Cylindrobasidium torrendii FP15055 ss-10]
MFALPILSIFAASVAGHAVVTEPPPRQAGAANLAACGSAVQKKLTDDETGPIENIVKVVDGDTTDACELYTCRSYLFDDNKDSVQTYAVGDVVSWAINLVAHHTGYANLSIIDTASNSAIESLYVWDVYANSSVGPSQWPADETAFEVTIPDVGTQCAEAGACAMQWYWYATENSQTYESCVDFVIA